MKNSIKVGFGLAVGSILGAATMKFISESLMKWGAKDKDFMKYEKANNPDLYENLKKYQPKEGA